MARTGDQFRNSDATFWGILALATWAVAALGANVSALIPDDVLAGLHASRLDGANLAQLRGDVAGLRTTAAGLAQQNKVLLQRLSLGEQNAGQMARRVGALELAVPKLLEAAASPPDNIDRSAITASTTTAPVKTFEAEGGTVSYTETPLSPSNAPVAHGLQPMPQELTTVTPDAAAFGIALGPPIDDARGKSAWQAMNDKVGTLLLGLGPLLANVEGGAGLRLVAGPLATEAEAQTLCGRIAKVGIACATVPFLGDPLPNAN